MINLEIPEQLIIKDSGEIRYELINGKTIIGLCGYARSGKDTLGSLLVERLSFKRISFADTLKKELNEHMKLSVFNDLQEKGFYIDFESVDFENPKKNRNKRIA
jgi:cytidylate kinase